MIIILDKMCNVDHMRNAANRFSPENRWGAYYENSEE
jgi:hypothetical protein